MASRVRPTSRHCCHGGPPVHAVPTCAGSTSMYRRPNDLRSRSSITGVVRNVMWSQLHTLTVPPANGSLAAVPPTVARASSSSVRIPAFARYAAVTRPLCPAPITITSASAWLTGAILVDG